MKTRLIHNLNNYSFVNFRSCSKSSSLPHLILNIFKSVLVFTCSCPMVGKPGEGPEAMDVTLICPAIWPMLLMLLVAMLVAIETLLRFMPLPLYMLLLFCWLNCGDACCCENMLWRGDVRKPVKMCELRPDWILV